MTASDTKVLQVTNISPSVTMEQLENLFSFLGPIDEMQVFPKTNTIPVASKVAFIRFQSTSPVATGQHLSNTVFIDKAIICVAYIEGKIPDESVANQYVAPATSESESEHQIPGNVDPNKVEEIKRTIYVGNLDSKTATAEQLLTFFTTCGEVRFVRMAGDETQPTRFAFVEFAETNSVQNALQLNGMLFGDRPIKVNHSNNAIVKPQGKTQETNAKEIEEAMRRVREAQSLISRALEPEVKEKKRRSRSRSRSRRRRRSNSGSRRRRSGSRSRHRRRSRSKSGGRSRSRRSRSRSSHRRRHRRSSRSRSRKRSRSQKKERSSSRKREQKEKTKSKSRSKSPTKKSSRHKKDRKRDRDRERDRDGKKRRKHSRSRSKSKDKAEKENKAEKKTEERKSASPEIKKEITSPEKIKSAPDISKESMEVETKKEVELIADVITNGVKTNGDT